MHRLGRPTHRTGEVAVPSIVYPAGVVPTLGALRITGSDYATLGSKDQWTHVAAGYATSDLDLLRSSSHPTPIKLVYMIPIGAMDTGLRVTSGVSKAEAIALGALATQGGGTNYLQATSYPFFMPLMADAGYQNKFCTNLLAILQTFPGINGIWYDNVDMDYHNSYGAGAVPDQYPTLASWQAACKSFYDAVNQFFQSRGYYILGNARGVVQGAGAPNDTGANTTSWWNNLVYSGSFRNGRSMFDCLAVEFWQQTGEAVGVRITGTANNVQQRWDEWQAVAQLASTLGADFQACETPGAISSAQDDRDARYCRASLLMIWDGGYSNIQWRSGTAMTGDASFIFNLGLPTGAATTPQTNVSRRAFANGIAIVNHSAGSITQDGHTLASRDAYIGA